MIFFSKPNHYVRIQQKNLRNGKKSGFYFDENGIYETFDLRLIERLKLHFKYKDNSINEEDRKIRKKRR